MWYSVISLHTKDENGFPITSGFILSYPNNQYVETIIDIFILHVECFV